MPSEKTKSSSKTEENLTRDKGPRLDSEPGILAKETDLAIEKAAQSGESVSNFIEDVSPKLTVIEGKPILTSLEIANIFGKEHYNVLRDIKALISECSEEFSALNFEGVDYKDAKGEMRPSFNINRDGFTMLAMGFTGKKAAAYREAYIRQFNQMEAKLVELQIQSIKDGLPKSKPVYSSSTHIALLKEKYKIYGDELDILHEILGNMLSRVDGVLSEQNATLFKNVFMRDWELRLSEAYAGVTTGSEYRLGTEFYKSMQEIHTKRIQIGECTEKQPFSREHAFSFVLHLLGEFCEEKYRGFWTGSYFGAPLKLKNGNDQDADGKLLRTSDEQKRIEKF